MAYSITSPPLLFSNAERLQASLKEQKTHAASRVENNPLIHLCTSLRWEHCSVLTLRSLHEVDDFSSKLMKCNKELIPHFRTIISHILVLVAGGEWISVRTLRRGSAHESAAGRREIVPLKASLPSFTACLIDWRKESKWKKNTFWEISWRLIVKMFQHCKFFFKVFFNYCFWFLGSHVIFDTCLKLAEARRCSKKNERLCLLSLCRGQTALEKLNI